MYCNNEMNFVCQPSKEYPTFSNAYLECNKCDSRSPSRFVEIPDDKNEVSKEYVKEYLIYVYKSVMSWDVNFKNPNETE